MASEHVKTIELLTASLTLQCQLEEISVTLPILVYAQNERLIDSFNESHQRVTLGVALIVEKLVRRVARA